MRITSIITALFAVFLMTGRVEKAHAGLFISITVAPPPLPVYVQPPIPGPNYLWTPGYWAWDGDEGDYYWVPGAWVPAPEPGLLWTPGYWGWRDGIYAWNDGYWGPTVGFYGGVDYGFGFTPWGFVGGSWGPGNVFVYNAACSHVSGVISQTNIVYNKTVVVNNQTVNVTNYNTTNNITKVSYAGGNGGTKFQPTSQQLAATNEKHIQPTADQMNHQHLAAKNPDLKFTKNQGKPAIAATSKAGDFSKGSTFGAKAAGGSIKPASFKTNTATRNNGSNTLHQSNGDKKTRSTTLGNQDRLDNKNHHFDEKNTHYDKRNNFIPPKGASINNQIRRPGPPPRPQPRPQQVNKQPPKKDPKQHG
jgi:hypothetical protein